MKRILLLLISLIFFQSCEVDDTDDICSKNCTSIIGKVIKADGAGIPNVKVTFSFEQFAPYSYTRYIAETYTDENGNYELIGFIKDSELGLSKSFRISLEVDPIENSLDGIYLKPSELAHHTVPRFNEIIISGVENRNQIEIVDFIVPFKSAMTVHLNNFEPIENFDNFQFRCDVQYGFENQKIPIYFGEAEQMNQEFNFTTGIGINSVKIYKVKNGLIDYGETQEVIISENPSNIILEFDY
jgi:hypothetical protein